MTTLMVLGLGMVALFAVPATQASGAAGSAWQQLLADRPGAGSDEGISPMERRILNSLTPDQAKAFYAGAAPETLKLADGTTLADMLANLAMGPGYVYVPVDSCRVLSTFIAGAPMGADEIRDFMIRGDDLTGQGGSATGCGIPAEAVAAVIQMRVSLPDGMGYLKGWPWGGAETVTQLVDYDSFPENHKFNSSTVMQLCFGSSCTYDFTLKTADAGAEVRVDTVGYFRAIEVADIPGGSGSGLDADLLDGLDSTDFALANHTHDGSAIVSGIVGATFIDSLIARDTEVFPIVLASDGPGSGLNADLLDGLNSTQFTRQLDNVVTVSASGGDFTTVQAAIDSILDASADNPYTVVVGPGGYLGTVLMKSFVDVVGAGQGVTTLRAASALPTVRTASNSTLSNLTVEAQGGVGSDSVAIFSNGSGTVRQVTANATGGSPITAAIRNSGGTGTYIQVTTNSAGGTFNFGVENVGASAVTYDQLKAATGGGSIAVAALNRDTSAMVLRNSVLTAFGGGTGSSAAAHAPGSNATTRAIATQFDATLTVFGAGFKCVGAYDQAFDLLKADCTP